MTRQHKKLFAIETSRFTRPDIPIGKPLIVVKSFPEDLAAPFPKPLSEDTMELSEFLRLLAEPKKAEFVLMAKVTELFNTQINICKCDEWFDLLTKSNLLNLMETLEGNIFLHKKGNQRFPISTTIALWFAMSHFISGSNKDPQKEVNKLLDEPIHQTLEMIADTNLVEAIKSFEYSTTSLEQTANRLYNKFYY